MSFSYGLNVTLRLVRQTYVDGTEFMSYKVFCWFLSKKLTNRKKEEQTLKTLSENHFTSSRSDRGRGKGRCRNRGVRNNNGRENQQQNHLQESQFQGKDKRRGCHHSTTYRSKSADKSNVECFRCHRYDHYKSEWQTDLNKQSVDQSNFVEKKEKLVFLMVCHMKEETQQNINHMCGEKKTFSDLDESFRSSVKFGDNSKISVMKKGKVIIQTKGNFTHTIANVLFVPDLKTNLVSVGQLQEKGYEIFIKNGVCKIHYANLGLIAQVNMTANRIFPLYLDNTTHSCFSVKLEDDVWI
ncbi:hypothetical protein Lal_00037977 [Lupinus albus]|nr:hypothetical protein Lal_00037977 [Lupinus albus]